MSALVAVAWLLAADPPADGGATVSPPLLVAQACGQCHSLKMISQQRLTPAQWTATLAKMRGWGAMLDDGQTAAVAEYLAAVQGPRTPLPEPVRGEGKALLQAFEPLAATLPGGDAQRGGQLFGQRCQVCHGPDARGLIGVNLVRRPILDRDRELAATVRKGRGMMIPNPDLSDAQFGDLIAYLKTLPIGAAR